MTSTEEKLARELGFRVDENGHMRDLNRSMHDHWEINNRDLLGMLWRKCLQLTEQRERGGGTFVASVPFWMDWFPKYAATHPDFWKEWKIVAWDFAEAYASSRLAAQLEDYISGLDKALEIVNHSLDEDKFLDGTARLPTACWSIKERIAQAILKERAIHIKGSL